MPPATTTSCGRPESSFCQFLALGNTQIYADYAGHYKRRFKWLRSTLFRADLERELRLDANALLNLLQNYGAWDPRHDAKLDALQTLVTKTYPDRKVLVFSQFADTVLYLETQPRTYLSEI